MSDTPNGPGWWQASDGRWYPPDAHPNATASPEARAEAEAGGKGRRTGLIVGGAVVATLIVLCGLGAVLAGGEPEADEPEEASSISSTTETTADTEPPTTTAAPTTEAPTTTTTTTTTAPPAPPPTVYEGSGDSVLEINNEEAVVVTLTHSGGSNFAVWALDSGLNQQDLLVNEVGPYEGTVPLDFRGSATKALEISADGAWKAIVIPLPALPEQSGAMSGTGDEVLYYTGSTSVSQVSHDGSSNFAVHTYGVDSGAVDLVINEIGPYSGSVVIEGPSLIEVSADGSWSIQPG